MTREKTQNTSGEFDYPYLPKLVIKEFPGRVGGHLNYRGCDFALGMEYPTIYPDGSGYKTQIDAVNAILPTFINFLCEELGYFDELDEYLKEKDSERLKNE